METIGVLHFPLQITVLEDEEGRPGIKVEMPNPTMFLEDPDAAAPEKIQALGESLDELCEALVQHLAISGVMAFDVQPNPVDELSRVIRVNRENLMRVHKKKLQRMSPVGGSGNLQA